jgi:hypothetical protein
VDVSQASSAFAAAALAAVVGISDVQPAMADVAGLTPCSESKGFAKQQKKELKTLEKRLKQVRAGTARDQVNLALLSISLPGAPCSMRPALPLPWL